MGSPQQSAHVDTSAGELHKDAGEGRPVVGQLLVVVTAPVREAHEIAWRERLQRLGEASEVGSPMDQGRDVIPFGPWPVANERGTRVHALMRVQEPRMPLLHGRTVTGGVGCETRRFAARTRDTARRRSRPGTR